MHYVIVGTGIAGASAAEAIRKLDPEGRITMIGDETGVPYCRPMISLVLEGSLPPERLPIRSARFFEALNITRLLGQRVTALNAKAKSVQVGGQDTVSFDRLLIASGADPRPIRAEGLNLANISYMRTQAHVRRMLQMTQDAKHALVLGGGLVGFKAAYGLLRRGLEVTMLIGSEHPLSLQVDGQAGQMILQELLRQGLKVRVGSQAKAFEGRNKVQQAHLSDGSRLDCDMVVIGKGVLPALSFVPREQIQVDLGILVDRHLMTSAPDIYAAGDAAEAVDLGRDRHWVNAIWPEAVMQGRLAGFNMAGRSVPYAGSLGRNVIRIFNLDVLSGGLFDPPADDGYDVRQAVDPRRGTYRKLVFKDDRLVGLVMVNQIENGGVLLALIQRRLPLPLPKGRLLDPALTVKQLMTHHGKLDWPTRSAA